MEKILGLVSEYKFKPKTILRDYLSLERTRLAGERTLLMFIRASLYLLLGGIAIVQLEGFNEIKALGFLSVVLSIILVTIGLIRFIHLKNQLTKFYDKIGLKRP